MSTEGYDSAKEGFDSAKEAAKETFENVRDSAEEAAKDLNKEYEKFTQSTDNKRILAGVMGLVFGYLGIHKFILGYTKEGVITIIASIVTCGIFGLVGFIEGIIYLTKSEEEFYQTYQANKKPWF